MPRKTEPLNGGVGHEWTAAAPFCSLVYESGDDDAKAPRNPSMLILLCIASNVHAASGKDLRGERLSGCWRPLGSFAQRLIELAGAQEHVLEAFPDAF